MASSRSQKPLVFLSLSVPTYFVLHTWERLTPVPSPTHERRFLPKEAPEHLARIYPLEETLDPFAGGSATSAHFHCDPGQAQGARGQDRIPDLGRLFGPGFVSEEGLQKLVHSDLMGTPFWLLRLGEQFTKREVPLCYLCPNLRYDRLTHPWGDAIMPLPRQIGPQERLERAAGQGSGDGEGLHRRLDACRSSPSNA